MDNDGESKLVLAMVDNSVEVLSIERQAGVRNGVEGNGDTEMDQGE